MASLALGAMPASADSFVRLIERPFVRYLLTETTQGQELITRVLGIELASEIRGASTLRRFATAMDQDARFARLNVELRDRFARTGESLTTLRSERGPAGETGDALGFLRRIARAEFRLAEATTGAAAEDLRFVSSGRDSYSALREDFVSGMDIDDGAHASLILEREIEGLLDTVRLIERAGTPSAVTIEHMVRGLRSAALETAVQMDVSRAAFSHHRASLQAVSQRLQRQIMRLPTADADGLHDLAAARARRSFLDQIEEAFTWIPTRSGS